MSRRTRQIVAFVIGDRSEQTCRQLWKRIPSADRACHSFSDFWDAYARVFPKETHRCVGKGTGETNHMERWNNTLRQRLARFVRKSLSFSKSELMHEICLFLFLKFGKFGKGKGKAAKPARPSGGKAAKEIPVAVKPARQSGNVGGKVAAKKSVVKKAPAGKKAAKKK